MLDLMYGVIRTAVLYGALSLALAVPLARAANAKHNTRISVTAAAAIIGLLSAVVFWTPAIAFQGHAIWWDPARYFGWRLFGTLDPLHVLRDEFGESMAVLAPLVSFVLALTFLAMLGWTSYIITGTKRSGLRVGVIAGAIYLLISIVFGIVFDATFDFRYGFLIGFLSMAVYPAVAYFGAREADSFSQIDHKTTPSREAPQVLSVCPFCQFALTDAPLVCPQCHLSLPDGSSSLGSEVVAARQVESQITEPRRKDMFCAKCGTQRPDEANFCLKCGQALHSASAPAAPSRKMEYRELSIPIGIKAIGAGWTFDGALSPGQGIEDKINSILLSTLNKLTQEGWEPDCPVNFHELSRLHMVQTRDVSPFLKWGSGSDILVESAKLRLRRPTT